MVDTKFYLSVCDQTLIWSRVKHAPSGFLISTISFALSTIF